MCIISLEQFQHSSVRQPCSRVFSSNRHSILLPIEINMRLNRGRPTAFPHFFSFVTRGEQDGHRDRIKALELCWIDRYNRGMSFGRRGLKDCTEKVVRKDREAQGSEREWVYILSFISLGITEKSYEGESADRKGVKCRLLERIFSANKGSFFCFFFFRDEGASRGWWGMNVYGQSSRFKLCFNPRLAAFGSLFIASAMSAGRWTHSTIYI